MGGKKKTNKDKLEDLKSEFEKIQEQHKDTNANTNIDKYLINPEEDLPEFGQIATYDYDNDIQITEETAKEVIDNLADLYLGDAPGVSEHPYILQKKIQDAEDYADARFLSKMSKKLLLQNLKQIDSGDVSARMYEVATKLMGEIREINKDSRASRSEIEDFYKGIRGDFGLNEMGSDVETSNDEDNETNIINSEDLNNKIDEYLKNKK